MRIGVLGAGHLGRIHMKLLQEMPQWKLVGFFDPDREKAMKAEEDFQLTCFESADTLINAVDVVDIVTPTVTHFLLAKQAIKKSKHFFVEKPMVQTLDEARKLVHLVHEANIKAMVGHVERFNPAYLALEGRTLNPMFIEAHRLSQFNPRGTDVSVVLDLMIHDIDIILSLVKANVKRISASGVPIISRSPDIANARIEFDNGCVANVTASRISMKNMRKSRIFQRDSYISVDFLDKKTEIITLKDEVPTNGTQVMEVETAEGEKRYLQFELPEVQAVNAIKMELELFYTAIAEGKETPVSVQDGYNALKIAHQIIGKLAGDRVFTS